MSHPTANPTDADRPTVRLPMTAYLEAVARTAAREAVEEYRKNCPIADLESRLRALEIRFGIFLGFTAGSGFLGGLAGGWLATILQH